MTDTNDTGGELTDEQADALLDRLLERAEEREDVDPGEVRQNFSRRSMLGAMAGAAGLGALAGNSAAAGSWGSASGSAGTESKPFTDLWARDGHFQSVELGGETRTVWPSGGGGAAATVVVAASDASDTGGADYVCDGTDDQAEINSAFTDLPAVGGSVALTEGTFNITASVTPSASSTLVGQGYGTRLFAVAGFNGNVIENSNNHVDLTGFRVDGNAANQTPTGNFEDQVGIYNAGGDYVHAHELTVENTVGSNFRSEGANLYIRVHDSLFDNTTGTLDNRADGISLSESGTSGRALITNNIVRNCSHQSIEMSSVERIVVANNYIENGSNISVNLHANSSTNGEAAFNIVCLGNIVRDSSEDAIHLKADRSLCIGNTVTGVTGSILNGNGIRLGNANSTGGANQVCVGNTVGNTQGHGIVFKYGDASIGMNTIEGAGQNGLRLESTPAVAMGNIVTGSTNQDVVDASGSAAANRIVHNHTSDESGEGVYVQDTEPTNPRVNDVWIH